jgi:hypothetical protein
MQNCRAIYYYQALKVEQRGISVSNAIEAGMLQQMDELEALRFIPTGVILYEHAKDRRYIPGIKFI